MLENEELTRNVELTETIFSDANKIFEHNTDEAGRIIYAQLTSDSPERWYGCIRAIAPPYSIDLVTALIQLSLPQRLRKMHESHAKWRQGKNQVSGSSAVTSVAEEQPEPISAAPALDLIGRWIDDLVQENRTAAELLMTLLLDVNHQTAREAAAEHVSSLTPIESQECSAKVLHAMTYRNVRDWPDWIAAVGSSSLNGKQIIASLQESISDLWSMACDRDSELALEDVKRAADAISGLLDSLSNPDRSMITFEPTRLSDYVDTPEDVSAQQMMRSVVNIFLGSGIVTADDISRAEMLSLIATFGAECSTKEAVDSPLVSHVAEAVRRTLSPHGGGPDVRTMSPANLLKLSRAVQECMWLPEPTKTQLSLQFSSVLGVSSSNDEHLPSVDDLLEFIEQYELTGTSTVTHWLMAKPHTAEEIVKIIKSYAQSTSTKFAAALSESMAHLSNVELGAVAKETIGNVDHDIPSPPIVEATTNRLHWTSVSNLLVDRFESCTNNAQRKAALTAWKAAQINTAQARKLGIERILLPMFDMNRQALEIALDFLSSFGPIPKDLKASVASRITNGVAGDDRLTRKSVHVLKGLGFSTKKHGLVPGFRHETTDVSED